MLNLFKRRRAVVAIDFDGTLLPTYEQIARWHDDVYGTEFSPFDASRWPDQRLVSLWGDDATAKAAQFYKTGFAYRSRPIDGAREALAEFANKVDFVVISSGSKAEQHKKKRWLARFFPEIKHIGFIADGETKRILCRKFGATIIVEDRYDYASDCARGGVDAIILERYRWGKGPDAPRIHNASDWTEISELIRKLLISRQLLTASDSSTSPA